MYQKVFPDRLKEIEAFLNQKEFARADKEHTKRSNKMISNRDGQFEEQAW